MYIDIHTHRRSEQTTGDTKAVVSAGISEDWVSLPFCMLGIHPWQVDEHWEKEFAKLEQIAATMPHNLIAIGECGLDKLRGGGIELQKACFQAQADLARRQGLPLVVHCVKAWEELLSVRIHDQHVIIHGFRGKPQLARQLLQRGFELSFGLHFNAESVRLAYAQRKMWMETDDGKARIKEVYEAVSNALNISPTEIELPGTMTF